MRLSFRTRRVHLCLRRSRLGLGGGDLRRAGPATGVEVGRLFGRRQRRRNQRAPDVAPHQIIQRDSGLVRPLLRLEQARLFHRESDLGFQDIRAEALPGGSTTLERGLIGGQPFDSFAADFNFIGRFEDLREAATDLEVEILLRDPVAGARRREPRL